MSTKSWKEQSEALFFIQQLSITEICKQVGKSRKYVSEHLRSCTGYLQEKDRRKKVNEKSRREYKRNWDKHNRKDKDSNEDEAARLKMQHIEAVNVLSHEKYY